MRSCQARRRRPRSFDHRSAAHPRRLQRLSDLLDIVPLRTGERQRHIPPLARPGTRARVAVRFCHDYRVSHPAAAEDITSPTVTVWKSIDFDRSVAELADEECPDGRPTHGAAMARSLSSEAARPEGRLQRAAKYAADTGIEFRVQDSTRVGGAVPQTALVPFATRHFRSRLLNFAVYSLE